MGVREDRLHFTQIKEYVAQRVGMSEVQAGRAILAVCEYLAINILKRLRVLVPHIGAFIVKDGKRIDLRFDTRCTFEQWLRDTAQSSYKPGMVDIVPDISLAGLEENNYLLRREEQLKEELETTPTFYKQEASLVQVDFLKYLQQQLPYQQPWRHPISKKLHSAKDIQEVIGKVYRHICPESYQCLWLLWVGVTRRRELADHTGLTAEQVRAKWGQAVDAVLVLLEFPELSPKLVKELIKEPGA